jgi:hypothetical protein
MSSHASLYIPTLFLGIAVAAPALADNTWTFASGADFSSGRYGRAEKTETLYVPFSAKLETESFQYKLTVPYVSIRGPESVSGQGGDRIDLGAAGGTRKREASGLGDVVFYTGWTFLERGGWMADLGGKVKFGTASTSKGLGTGKNDYSVQTDLYRSLGGGHTLFGTLGYRKMGDPDGIDLRDPFYSSLGWSWRQSPRTSFGASYDYRQKLQERGAAVSEGTLFMTHKLGDGFKLQAYVVKGFSDASPDLGGGVILMVAR